MRFLSVAFSVPPASRGYYFVGFLIFCHEGIFRRTTPPRDTKVRARARVASVLALAALVSLAVLPFSAGLLASLVLLVALVRLPGALVVLAAGVLRVRLVLVALQGALLPPSQFASLPWRGHGTR